MISYEQAKDKGNGMMLTSKVEKKEEVEEAGKQGEAQE